MTSEDSDKVSIALVDDSGVIRGVLARILTQNPNTEIIASVSNAETGVNIARLKKPDILILDVEMPVMDGITALPKIIEASPETKVIMCSTLTEREANITMKAMSLGAINHMLRSLISIYGKKVLKKVLCAILAGMGADGLKGAQELTGIGGRVIAQDEKTSIVWGMLGTVTQNQLCSAVLPLDDRGPWLMKAIKG